jgi:hypothetical protein
VIHVFLAATRPSKYVIRPEKSNKVRILFALELCLENNDIYHAKAKDVYTGLVNIVTLVAPIGKT